jgi:ankyrin repeat protein
MRKDWQEATQLGECEKVRSLIDQGADINSLDKHSQTALMNATYHGDTNLVRVLVDHGAKLDISAKYNLTALMLAVINKHNEIVRILVEAGANTELKGSEGSFELTPLEYAIEHGNDEIVSILSNCT